MIYDFVLQSLDDALLTVEPPDANGCSKITFSAQLHAWPNITSEDIINALLLLLDPSLPPEEPYD